MTSPTKLDNMIECIVAEAIGEYCSGHEPLRRFLTEELRKFAREIVMLLIKELENSKNLDGTPHNHRLNIVGILAHARNLGIDTEGL